MNNQNTIQVQKKSSKKMIIPFVALIAILFISNLIMIGLAFFTDKATGESIVTFGSIETSAYIMENSQKSTTITLDSNGLIAGAETEKELHIDVTGKNDCYVRVTGEFRVAVDGSTYIDASDLVSFSIDTTTNSGWKLCDDGKYYYTSILSGTDSGNASKLTLNIKFTVSEDFGNSNLDGTSVYKNKPYNIIVSVESCQSEGTSIGSGNTFDYTKWVEN